ncbi:MAG: Fatty acid metabolism regulator protein [Sodalis sp.]|nr:MAG: Fatty acid metabolism regulator protein [Sodalis sp.]
MLELLWKKRIWSSKAQSPAGFAEEFLIESIWNNRFASGSILPATRKLSNLIIGTSRTTLREVPQRRYYSNWPVTADLNPARQADPDDNIWETSDLNILETLSPV